MSRLRGHLNTLGPDEQPPDDEGYLLRRAVVLRQLIESVMPSIIQGGVKFAGLASVQPDVLNAFLKVPHYRHGIRSIEAILEMCRMSPTVRELQASSLPSRDELDMHVDGASSCNFCNM